MTGMTTAAGRRLLAAAGLLLAACSALAQGTMVRLHTTQGPIDLQLLDAEAPRTVANFLAYVRGGDYSGVFFHRSVPGFVIQGGGFRWASGAATCCSNVTSRGYLVNEFSATRSNLRGTVAMAKLGQSPDGGVTKAPDTASSQWFINLANNAANLDTQNGGFTVFARVTAPGMVVADKVAALPTINAGGNFTNLPVVGLSGNTIFRENMVIIDSVTEMPPRAQQTEAERVLNYLEAAYPQYLSPSKGAAGSFDGYTYRYYGVSNAYVGIKDGKVWYLVPALSPAISLLGGHEGQQQLQRPMQRPRM